jgi:hypothetical protein
MGESVKGFCRSCGERVYIDVPPDGHTRAAHAPDCDGNCKGGCPVPVLCGPVDADLVEGEDFPDVEELLKPYPLYQAAGNTYPYRGEFRAWGWGWNEGLGVWELETGDEDDPCLEAVRRLPGVTVVKVSESEEDSDD